MGVTVCRFGVTDGWSAIVNHWSRREKLPSCSIFVCATALETELWILVLQAELRFLRLRITNRVGQLFYSLVDEILLGAWVTSWKNVTYNLITITYLHRFRATRTHRQTKCRSNRRQRRTCGSSATPTSNRTTAYGRNPRWNRDRAWRRAETAPGVSPPETCTTYRKRLERRKCAESTTTSPCWTFPNRTERPEAQGRIWSHRCHPTTDTVKDPGAERTDWGAGKMKSALLRAPRKGIVANSLRGV